MQSSIRLLCGCSLIALVAAGLPAQPAQAREVGVTAAVRPDVLGMPPGLEDRILAVGVDLFADEVIRTSKRGQTHLLFIDGSSLSVGPNAELKLDRFVYDPETKTGDLVITASKGLMRFVGGRLSKKKPVLIKTPTAVIGIRGGVAMMQVGDGQTTPPTSVTMLFGDEVSMESNGQRQSMTRPGFQLTEQPGGGVNPPRQVTQQELNQQLQNLEEPPVVEEDEDLGAIAPAGGGGVSDQDVADSQMDELGSSNDPNSVGGPSGGPPPSVPSGDEEGELVVASQQEMTETGEPPAGDSGGTATPVGVPVDTNTGTNLANESAANGSPVGIVAGANGTTPRFRLLDNAGGRFAIDEQTGQVSVANAELLDAETAQSHTITVEAFGTDGSSQTADFTISIGDDNTEYSISAVTDANATSNSLNHGSAAGTLANITGRATDADVTDGPNIGYSLTNTGGNRFQINTQTGVVTTSGQSSIDFKANRRHTVAVTATSPDNSTNISNFSIEVLYNNFVGRLKRDASTLIEGSNDNDPNNNSALNNVVLGFGDLSATVSGGTGNIAIPFPDSPGSFTVTSGNNWPFGNVAGSGMGFLNDDQSFVYYNILDTQESRTLLFAGDPTTTFPSTGITGYNLTDDFVRNSDLPFLDSNIVASPNSHGEIYIAWNDDAAQSQRAVGGGMVLISGTGAAQKAGSFVITGRVFDFGAATENVIATFFGQSSNNATGQPVYYEGGLASSDAGDGSDFFGGDHPSAFVLEAATVNGADEIQSRGIDRTFQGTTTTAAFFANSVATEKAETSFNASRTAQTLHGFAAGRERAVSGATEAFSGNTFTLNNDPTNVSITTNPSRNTLDASFQLMSPTESEVVYNFGGTTGNGSSAFIEDGRFFAQESPGNEAEVDESSVTSRHALATSDIVVFANSAKPSNVNLCTCEHLVWGFWGAERKTSSMSNSTSLTHLATWVAGSLASDVQVTGAIEANAVYSGHMIGNVNNGGNRYVAVGGISLTFDFNGGNFTLDDVTVTNFDGVNYTASSSGGSLFATNAYSSSNAGLSITGGGNSLSLSGAFFEGQAAPNVPLATAGQGSISGSGYNAAFTYATQYAP